MTARTFPQMFAHAWAQQHGWPDWASGDTLTAPPGPCALCGGHTDRRQPWSPPDTFPDVDRLRAPTERAICQACALLTKGGPSRNERGNWRKWTLYSLAVSPDGNQCWLGLKNEKPRMRQLLAEGWALAANDTGKKHVAFWAPTPARNMVVATIDRQPVRTTPQQWQQLLELCDTAYRAGVAKQSLATNQLTQSDRKRLRTNLGLVRAIAIEHHLTHIGLTPARQLAVWLAQKEAPNDTTPIEQDRQGAS